MTAAELTPFRLFEMLERDVVIRGEIFTQGLCLPRIKLYTFGRDARYAGGIMYVIRENNFQAAADSIKLGTRLSLQSEQRLFELNELIRTWQREQRVFGIEKPVVILGNPGRGPKTLLAPNDPRIISQLSRLLGLLACRLSDTSWPPGPDQKMWRSILGHIYNRLDRLIMYLTKPADA